MNSTGFEAPHTLLDLGDTLTISASDNLEHWQHLNKAQFSVWGYAESLSECRYGSIPSPLFALAGPHWLGGLGFTWHPAPGSDELGLWINVVYVLASHRRRGIASALIQHACDIHAEQPLYVLSEYPELYQRLGWRSVANQDRGTILVFRGP